MTSDLNCSTFTSVTNDVADGGRGLVREHFYEKVFARLFDFTIQKQRKSMLLRNNHAPGKL